MQWLGLKGTSEITEPEDGLGWERPQRSLNHRMVGLEGSLKIIEPWNGWVGSVLKGHGTIGWLGWKGPERSQNHRMVGLGRSLKITEP